jgi:6-phosphogluconate dehydrogenase
MVERDVGLIGLGVMGQSLALNLQNHDYNVAVYNRTEQKTREFIKKHSNISAAYTLSEFVSQLRQPRKIILMLTAGPAIDIAIQNLTGLLSPSDVLVDGGNSFFQDTERRCNELLKHRISFLGAGVSGGEEGALRGPCIMVGGTRDGYEQVSDMLRQIAAQVDGPCCEYLGPRGAGHYVKMVHNGIEYAIIQIIAETYDLLTRAARLTIKQTREVFKEWNEGELNSFLMEITVDVLSKNDPDTHRPLVSFILDRAKQKGTGKWTSQNAFDLGIPTPTIDAAVSARNLSALKEERVKAAKTLKQPKRTSSGAVPGNFAEQLMRAAHASIIVAYSQGFHLMRAASSDYKYDLPFSEIARIWKGGCIIRSRLLDQIMKAFEKDALLQNLMVDPEIATKLTRFEKSWRDSVKSAKELSIPIPALNASLDYYDGYRSEKLPANIIQALRDHFGAHTYERTDKPGDFHSNWTMND